MNILTQFLRKTDGASTVPALLTASATVHMAAYAAIHHSGGRWWKKKSADAPDLDNFTGCIDN